MKNRSIWTSFATALLGLWLLAAPATFNFESTPLIWSDLIAGFLLIIFGLASRKGNTLVFPWIIGLIGIWLNFAPLLFKVKDPACYLNDTLIGALAIAFSLLIPKLPNDREDEERSIPPGWTYNPSSWPQRLPIALLVFICWMISRYLAAFELGYIDVAWDPFFYHGTERVLTSTISRDFPLPDAGLGAFAYTLEFLSTCQGGRARWRTDPWLVLVFGALVIPVGFISVCLIILQPIAVGTWCTLCLCTAICMLTVIPFALDEVAAALQHLKNSKEKPLLELLFSGGECKRAKVDKETPDLEEPLWILFKASLRGITAPWNLIVSAAVGIVLMILPWPFHLEGIMEDFDPIIGAFTIVFSIISMSEIARVARWALLILGLALLITTLCSIVEIGAEMTALHLSLAIFLGLLSIPEGHFYEKVHYSSRS